VGWWCYGKWRRTLRKDPSFASRSPRLERARRALGFETLGEYMLFAQRFCIIAAVGFAIVAAVAAAALSTVR